MAKGNDGNYFQHSVEMAVAIHLLRRSPERFLHIALTHGMAPFECCDALRQGQSRKLLERALDSARAPSRPDEAPIITGYRTTGASLTRYPNTGELLAALIGRSSLTGGITDVEQQKYAELVEAWAGSSVMAVASSWRREVHPSGVLSCSPSLRSPWLFSADPMTFREDGYEDDNKLYRADLPRLAATLKSFGGSGEPGIAILFVYAVRPTMRPRFWDFADDLAASCSMSMVPCWMKHQGGNRNLAALFCSGTSLPSSWEPNGVYVGNG